MYLKIWVNGHISKSAHILAHNHSDITIFSPRCRPAVSYNPIVSFFIVTDSGYSVVQKDWKAKDIIKNSTSVFLESRVGIDGDGNNTISGNGIFKIIFTKNTS